eukprot:2910829-Karenia_brevis.AAC.1
MSMLDFVNAGKSDPLSLQLRGNFVAAKAKSKQSAGGRGGGRGAGTRRRSRGESAGGETSAGDGEAAGAGGSTGGESAGEPTGGGNPTGGDGESLAAEEENDELVEVECDDGSESGDDKHGIDAITSDAHESVNQQVSESKRKQKVVEKCIEVNKKWWAKCVEFDSIIDAE